MTARIKKKGMENAIVYAIIGLVVLVILGLFVNKWWKTADAQVKDATCKQSIEHSALKLRAAPSKTVDAQGQLISVVATLNDMLGNPTQIECSTDYIEVKLAGLTAKQKEEKAKKVLADEMVHCWGLYGAGQKEIFDTKDEVYCAVCSRITFKEDIEVRQFVQYLQDQQMPLSKGTYWDYIMEVDMKNYDPKWYENSGVKQWDHFSTKDPLAIIFVMGKEAYPGSLIGTGQSLSLVTGGTFGGILGLVAGGAFAYGFVTGVGLCATVVGCPVGLAVIGVTALATGVATAATTGAAGYALGSDHSADWKAQVMLAKYDYLKYLNCTYLEAKSAPLAVVQK